MSCVGAVTPLSTALRVALEALDLGKIPITRTREEKLPAVAKSLPLRSTKSRGSTNDSKMLIRAGCEVEVIGITSSKMSAMNGKRGRAIQEIAPGHFNVMLESSKKISLSTKNLKLIDSERRKETASSVGTHIESASTRPRSMSPPTFPGMTISVCSLLSNKKTA